MKRRLFAIAQMLLMCTQVTYALEPVDYNSPAEEQRFKALTAELRCVMCQNQSIADSNAPIAHDLRAEVLRLIREGKSNDEIKRYLVERYTEFVLYEPPMHGGNWLLWAGPFLLLLGGGFWVARVIRNKSGAAKTAVVETDQEW